MRSPWIPLVMLALLVAADTAPAKEPLVVYETTLSTDYYLPHARDIVADEAGNAYLIGSAYEDHNSLDVLVAKLDAQGNEVWTYYYANSGHSYASGIALDSSGHPWVTGWTDDAGFPLVNPIDSEFDAREMFVMKFDPVDGGILYSTFLGGDYTDTGDAIAINDQDEIIIGGTSGSTDFPTTPDAWQSGPSAPLYVYQDGVIVKLSPSGGQILYATYFGGFEDDWIDDIALDAQGNIILAGHTNADDFPLESAIDAVPNDLFISKLSADGQELLFSTYFGGSDSDRLSRISSDGDGNVCVAGITRSVDLPTTPGTFSPDFVGEIYGCEEGFPGNPVNCEDFFVFRLSTNGGGLEWGTYLGGTTVDEARGIMCDELGNVYVTGYTSSEDFPLYEGGFGAAFLVCRLSDDASTLEFTHFVESGSANRGNGIFVSDKNDIYFTGTVGVPASIYISKLQGEGTISAVDDGGILALKDFTLGTNYPNPFNPGTSIRFTLPDGVEGARVRLSILDAAGHRIRLLLDGEFVSAGHHVVDWRGKNEQGQTVPSGVYFYRLEAGDYVETRKMMLVR